MLLCLAGSFGKALKGVHSQARERPQDAFKDIAIAQAD
jgi:hypothetical protein